MKNLLEFLCEAAGIGLSAFLYVAGLVLFVVSGLFSFWLILDIIAGAAAPWYHIAAPFVFFLGIGMIVVIIDN